MIKEYEQLIDDFKKARMDLLVAVQNFHPDNTNLRLFGEWNLKQLIGHIAAWDEHVVECVEAIVKNEVPSYIDNTDDFNAVTAKEVNNLSYEEIYENFIEAGALVIEAYKNLPDEYWERKFWNDKISTPKSYLEVEIKHYKEDHLDAVLKHSQPHSQKKNL